MTEDLTSGARFPDLDLPDHTGRPRTLSEIAAGDPLALVFSRGWWCPKEQTYMRELVGFQEQLEVAYGRIAVVSVDPPEVQSAFRAGLGARFPFLSDGDRRWLGRLDLREKADSVHEPYLPTCFTLFPDLTIHRRYDGYWYFARPTIEELRGDMRAISSEIRADWHPD